MTYLKERGHSKIEDFMSTNAADSAYKAPLGEDNADGETLIARRPALEAGLAKAAAFAGDKEIDDGLVWRKLEGDVMRSPAFPSIWAMAMGSGAQICFVYALLLSCGAMHL